MGESVARRVVILALLQRMAWGTREADESRWYNGIHIAGCGIANLYLKHVQYATRREKHLSRRKEGID